MYAIRSYYVPARNEAATIAATVLSAREAGADEVIVVDGESRDGTPDLARPIADAVILSPPGRARQMNAGATASVITSYSIHYTKLYEYFVVNQVACPDPGAGDLVLIAGAYSAGGRADLPASQSFLQRPVEDDVVRENDVSYNFV